MEPNPSFNYYLQKSVREHWNMLALTDYQGISLQYRDIGRKIAKLHILMEEAGVKKGDRIAICGRNSSHWSIAFFATLAYGAVAVPLLPDFHPDNLQHLVEHSEARLAFFDLEIWENLDIDSMPGLLGAFAMPDYSLLHSRSEKLSKARHHLNELFGQKYPDRFTEEDVVYHVDSPEDLVMINYTSGSTGMSKGVMIPSRALSSNLQYCLDHIDYIEAGDNIVCMLPMAHMYGLSIDLVNCLCRGCHLHFLTRLPSPAVIIKAFQSIKPKMIVAVPLIIEKIIRQRVFPMLDKPLMKLMLRVPYVDDKLCARIKNGLIETFGGNVREIIIGGAALNGEVEAFLRRINFPFTAGYGMTECAPLISYAPWRKMRPSSCGTIVDRMEARIDSSDPANQPGVLWVRGANVMLGYYKRPEATEAVMADGWLNTGDICVLDKDNYLYIRGRDKNMILGPSGQNIYPEEIEQVLNNLPYVAESLIVSTDNNQLRALIYPDYENALKQGLNEKQIYDIMQQNLKQLNNEMPAYSHVNHMTIMKEEFEKTPKRSIKRYLYQH